MVASLIAGVLAVAGVGLAEQPDVSIDIGEGGEATTEDHSAVVVAEDHDPPEAYAWELALDEDYHLVNVSIDDGFPIDRGRQLVPRNDSSHFVEVQDPTDLDRPAEVFNLSQDADGWTYQLGIPGPAQTELVLDRDVRAPAAEIVDVGNVTDVGFDVTTDTDERAAGVLSVYEGDEAIQDYPVGPGIYQEFPVQGLDANTTYEVQAELHDWSENTAQTDRVEVQTEDSEEPPGPSVEPVRPAPNATVSPDGVVVEASYTEDGWPVVEDDVAMFFDKERVDRADLEVGDGSIVYRADSPLQERTYFVSVEVPNTAGGEGVARWSFQVEEGPATNATPAPGGLLALVLAAGGLALVQRRE